MESNKLNRADNAPGILDELESVKDALHAVDGDIEGLLTRPSSEQAPGNDTVSTIPTLNDVVNEPSADHQLSRTNKYKTLSDSDLERAAMAETEANSAPAPAEPFTDDEADIDFEDDLDDLDLELDNADIAGPGDAEDVELPPDDFILPDIEQLDADLGVEPLPDTDRFATTENGEFALDLPEEFDTDVAGDTGESPPGAETDATPLLDIPGFSLSSSTRFDVTDGGLLGEVVSLNPGTPSAQPPALTPEQLTQLIEQVLDSHMVSLQEALLERLAPFVSHDNDKPS